MAKKKYIVSLTTEERETLEQLTTTGKATAYKMNHARILLKADTNQEGGGWTDEAISQALDISVQGKRILSEQDLEQVVLIPPCSQSLVLDAEFCSGLLSQ
jgi:hypothetical protein